MEAMVEMSPFQLTTPQVAVVAAAVGLDHERVLAHTAILATAAQM